MRKDCKLQEPYEVAERIYALLVSKNEQRKYVIVNGGKFRFEPSFTSHQRVSQGAVALASPLGAIVVGGIGVVVSLRDLVETVQIIRNDAGITWCTVPRLMLDVAGLALGSTSLVQGIRGWRASGSLLEWRPAVLPINSHGVPYPDVDVPGYGKVPFPEGPYTPNNTQLRSQFTQAYRLQLHFTSWWRYFVP